MFHPEDEIITEKTSYIDEDGNVAPMTEEKALYFRTYEAEKVPAGEELEKCVLPEDDLILLAIVGIKDPCRPGVKDSVQLCQNAGVKVRMVTGDNVQTARAIALECGILTSDADASEPTLIEGKSFRAMTDAERDKISDKISLGCILFYAFTGHHPYGDEKVRGNNIRQSSRVKVITSLLKNCEAACLIANLLERNQGITASDAVQHPLFWDSDRRRKSRVELCSGWNKLLDADLVSHMVAMGGNYNYNYVKDLLRFIRNVISHYREFPSEIQAIVSDGVEQYFALKLERLLMDVYTAISKNCKGNATFRAYFLP